MQVQRRRGLKTKSAKIREQEGHRVQSREQAQECKNVAGTKGAHTISKNTSRHKKYSCNQDRAVHVSARQDDAPPAFILGWIPLKRNKQNVVQNSETRKAFAKLVQEAHLISAGGPHHSSDCFRTALCRLSAFTIQTSVWTGRADVSCLSYYPATCPHFTASTAPRPLAQVWPFHFCALAESRACSYTKITQTYEIQVSLQQIPSPPSHWGSPTRNRQ